jgi:hypothetical protein
VLECWSYWRESAFRMAGTVDSRPARCTLKRLSDAAHGAQYLQVTFNPASLYFKADTMQTLSFDQAVVGVASQFECEDRDV